jgi:hypothetical protein
VQNLIHFDKISARQVVREKHAVATSLLVGFIGHASGLTMKKFSTAACFIALFSAANSFAAPDSDMESGAAKTTVPAETTATAAATLSARCIFLPNAPDQHVVVRGDTLWDISGRFLQHPWCWPQVWGMNQDQIRNPHWIYPGQIVYFDRTAGRLRLGNPTSDGSGTGSAGAVPTVRLSAQLRTEGLGQQAVPSIPSGAIEPFLSQPLVVEESDLQTAPRIIATDEGRVVLGKDDKAYVRGELKDGTSFQVFRTAAALKDPVDQSVLGHEAIYLGTIKLERAARSANEAHVFRVVNVKEEMGVGDRLLPMPPTPIINYVPHPPEKPVEARIVSIYGGGISQAGQNQIVSINRGKKDNIDTGTVLGLYRFGQTVIDRTEPGAFWIFGKKQVKLPDEHYGNVFIFRAFNNISYGLIMQVTDTVRIGDIARSPE